MKKNIKFLIIFIAILVVISSTLTGYYFYIRSKIYEKTPEAITKINTNANIGEKKNKELYKEQKGIINILLIGVDARNLKEKARSDSMIILTIDDNNRNIKFTSFLRDSYVNISGHKTQKLNAAYAFGGPELLMNTLYKNFNIKIDKYVIVNFWGFQDIIDALGGLDISIKDYEIKEMNKFIGEVSKKKSPDITHSGLQHLDGQQVLSYSRIRHVGDGSYERAQRQRLVLTKMSEKLKTLTIFKYPSVLSKLLPHVRTNIEPATILNYAYTVSKFKPLQINQLQMPITELSDGRIYNNTWVFIFDKDQNSRILHDFIFYNKIANKHDYNISHFKRKLRYYLDEEKSTYNINFNRDILE